jgi:transposase-like protein
MVNQSVGSEMDPFVPALEELAQALLSDEDPEEALADIAKEHGLAAQALRNRAARTFGPFDTYKQRQADLKKEREQTAMRRDPVLAGASFVASVSNLNPQLSAADRQSEIQRLAAQYGVDPAAHRDAIERLRRR